MRLVTHALACVLHSTMDLVTHALAYHALGYHALACVLHSTMDWVGTAPFVLRYFAFSNLM